MIGSLGLLSHPIGLMRRQQPSLPDKRIRARSERNCDLESLKYDDRVYRGVGYSPKETIYDEDQH